MVADGPETRKNDMEVMGHRGPWLAFVGVHDVVDHESTLIFIDQPSNPRYPNRWFARTESNVGASFALTYDALYLLEPDETLALNYKMIFANGGWSRQEIGAFVDGLD
jgi:hypothetical protein